MQHTKKTHNILAMQHNITTHAASHTVMTNTKYFGNGIYVGGQVIIIHTRRFFESKLCQITTD